MDPQICGGGDGNGGRRADDSVPVIHGRLICLVVNVEATGAAKAVTDGTRPGGLVESRQIDVVGWNQQTSGAGVDDGGHTWSAAYRDVEQRVAVLIDRDERLVRRKKSADARGTGVSPQQPGTTAEPANAARPAGPARAAVADQEASVPAGTPGIPP